MGISHDNKLLLVYKRIKGKTSLLTENLIPLNRSERNHGSMDVGLIELIIAHLGCRSLKSIIL